MVLLLLAGTGAAADFSQRDWRSVKEIILPAGLQPDSLVEFSPDTEVFTEAARGLADLRIISDDAGEIPYKLEISQAEQERDSFPVTLRDKGYLPSRYDTFTADLGKTGILHNEIEFHTPIDDFRRTATVEASNDESTWLKIAEQTVYAFTVEERKFATRDTSIGYPESTARYLRVRILDDGDGSLKISGATVFHIKDTSAQYVDWPATILETYQDTAKQTTNVEIDLKTAGLPNSRIELDIPDASFYRSVSLEKSKDGENWTMVRRRGDIFAFDTPKASAKSVEISYLETTDRYLRIAILDEDSPPLTVAGVKVQGLSRRIVFTADPGQSYRLYYGNSEAGHPSYDLEKIFPYLVTETLPKASLGPQADNPEYAEKKPPVSERYPWLFPTVIAVAAVVVVLLLLIIFRQVRKALPPPEE